MFPGKFRDIFSISFDTNQLDAKTFDILSELRVGVIAKVSIE